MSRRRFPLGRFGFSCGAANPLRLAVGRLLACRAASPLPWLPPAWPLGDWPSAARGKGHGLQAPCWQGPVAM
eukprot:15437925-Alexandrium_andersonii.AAC.1